MPSHAPSWVFIAPKNRLCRAVRWTGFESGYRALRVPSRKGLVAILSEVIGWHQNGLSGVTALIWMIKVIVQAAAFLSAQGGPDN